jgi:hypothetical protein
MMFEQFPPLASQRCHWNANVIGAVPDQLPVLAVSVEPSRGVPEIVGGTVFAGALARPPITPVDARAFALPSALRAVTKNSRRRPRSSGVSVCCRDVCPAIGAQLATCELQRIHWYVNVIGDVPDQAPGFPVSVSPTRCVPEIVGGDVFLGAAVAADGSADPAPAAITNVSAAARPAAAAVPSLVTQRVVWHLFTVTPSVLRRPSRV